MAPPDWTLNRCDACIVTALSSCTNGAVVINGQCYFISVDQLTYFKARMDCVARGGDLSKLTNQAQLDALKASDYLESEKYWIGLVGLVWYWPDGALIA